MQYVREYYFHLVIRALFESKLKKITALVNRYSIVCSANFATTNDENKKLLQKLKQSLSLANISLEDNSDNKNVKYHLRIISETLTENLKKEQNNTISLIFDRKADVSVFNGLNYIDFKNKSDYYFSILKLVEKIIDKPGSTKIIQEFKDEHKKLQDSWQSKNQTNQNLTKLELSKKQLPSKKLALFTIVIFALLVLYFLSGKSLIGNQNQVIKSDLILPHHNVLLSRPAIMAEIDKKLPNLKGIQTIALTGIGGSGKTTIARQYAKTQNSNLVWEINAETTNSIKESFETLAHSLAKTPEDKEIIKYLVATPNQLSKDDKIINFVKKKLKLNSKWVLIYDNVENLVEIQKYIPQDPDI